MTDYDAGWDYLVWVTCKVCGESAEIPAVLDIIIDPVCSDCAREIEWSTLP